MSEQRIIEQRTVCDTCGQVFGGFHKGCDGKWVTQRREVTEWETQRNEIRSARAARAICDCAACINLR